MLLLLMCDSSAVYRTSLVRISSCLRLSSSSVASHTRRVIDRDTTRKGLSNIAQYRKLDEGGRIHDGRCYKVTRHLAGCLGVVLPIVGHGEMVAVISYKLGR